MQFAVLARREQMEIIGNGAFEDWVEAVADKGRQVAESTLTAIMGRISTYTGQTVKWEWVLNKSQLDLTPPKYDLAEKFPVAPVPVPGKDELV